MIEIPDFMEDDIRKKTRMYLNILRNRCTLCNHEGIIVKEDSYTNCSCVKEFEQSKKYIYSNLPLDNLNIKLEDLKKIYELLCFDAYSKIINNIKILINKGYNILFKKKIDTSWGVSNAGTLFCKECIELDLEVFVIDSLSIFDTFFSFGDNKDINKKKLNIFNFFLNVPILMIDGFGTEGYKDKNNFALNKFLSFLNLRRSSRKVTIICSEVTSLEIEKNYDMGLVLFLKNEMINFPISCNENTNNGNMDDKLGKDIPELSGLFKKEQPKRTIIKSDPKLDKLG